MLKLNRIKLPLAALAGLMIFSCGSSSSKPQEAEIEAAKVEKVVVIPVAEQTVGRTIDYPCTLNPFEDNYLAPASPGRVEKIFVEVGSRVAKGDIIAQMDKTQLTQAELQLETLKLDYNRLDTLAKLGSIARQQYDQIKGQYDIAKTNVKFLKENTQLTAPFSGVIAAKYFENGELYSGAPNTVAGKAALVHLIQIDNLKAFVSIPEKYYPKVKQGLQVAVSTEIYPNETFEGTVFRIHPTVDPLTHTFQAEIKIPNGKNLLRPGMYTHISFEIDRDKALLVPAAAVLKLQGSNDRYVFIAENGKAKRVSVHLGKRFDANVEIISNEIKTGDSIICKGQARLSDGVLIEPVTDEIFE